MGQNQCGLADVVTTLTVGSQPPTKIPLTSCGYNSAATNITCTAQSGLLRLGSTIYRSYSGSGCVFNGFKYTGTNSLIDTQYVSNSIISSGTINCGITLCDNSSFSGATTTTVKVGFGS